MSRFTVAVLLFFTALAAHAQPINRAKLDSLLTALETNSRFMGSIELAKNGTAIYSRELGYSTIDGKTKTRTTPQTEYRIGSASKMFTASIIFQLIEAKKLTLTTPLADFFPQIPNAQKITIGMMLSHHSGIHDFTRDSTYWTWLSQPQTEEQMLAKITSGRPAFEPGTSAAYSNSNFVLLGYIIEKITKHPYATEFNNRIVKPLQLTHTYYGSTIGSHPNEAQSFAWNNGEWQESSETDMSIPGGAGAIVSTTDDMTRFLNALFHHKIVSKASLDQMMTINQGFGMGLFQIPFDNRVSFGHSGRIDEFTSSAGYFPDDSTSLVVLSNGSHSFNSVLIGLLSIWNNRPYEIPSFKTYTVAAEKLHDYEGNYTLPESKLALKVGIEDGTLFAQATGQSPFPLDPAGEDTFRFDDAGIQIQFERTNNSVTGLSITQNGHSVQFRKD